MTSKLNFGFILILFFLILFGHRSQAAISNTPPQMEEVHRSYFSKKKKKIGWWKKLKAKIKRASPKKNRDNLFGWIGILFFIGGIVFVFLGAFWIGVVGSFIFGLSGLIADKRKALAIFSVILSSIIFIIALSVLQ